MVRPTSRASCARGTQAELEGGGEQRLGHALKGELTLEILDADTQASLLRRVRRQRRARRRVLHRGRRGQERERHLCPSRRRAGSGTVAFKVDGDAPATSSDGELRPLPVLPSRDAPGAVALRHAAGDGQRKLRLRGPGQAATIPRASTSSSWSPSTRSSSTGARRRCPTSCATRTSARSRRSTASSPRASSSQPLRAATRRWRRWPRR